MLENPQNQELVLLLLAGMLILAGVLALVASIFALTVVRIMLQKQEEQKASEAQEVYVPSKETSSIFSWLWQQLNGNVPIAKESTIMLNHNYDGIRELDNHLPPWWTYLFFITIGFSVWYMVDYHVLETSPKMEEEYQIAMKKAEIEVAAYMAKAAESIDEKTVKLVSDEKALASGKQIYLDNCAACHRPDGGGSVGPNLCDEYWIHGGSVNDIFKTIKYGVPEKGMVSWQKTLKPGDIQNVTSFILTLQGTMPENGKEPQGEKYEATKVESPNTTEAQSNTEQKLSMLN